MPVYSYVMPGRHYYEQLARDLLNDVLREPASDTRVMLITEALMQAWRDGKEAADRAEIGW